MPKLLFSVFFLLSGVLVAQDLPAGVFPADVANPDALVKAYFKAISGPPGSRDYNRLRGLFLENAQVNSINYGAGDQTNITYGNSNDFIEGIKPFFDKNGFYQVELKRNMDRYANVAQVFSSYKSTFYFPPNGDARMEIGIINFQLVRAKQRWWIASLLWNAESGDVLVPQDMLPEEAVAEPVDTPPDRTFPFDTSTFYPGVEQVFSESEVDVQPNFPGGKDRLLAFLRKHPSRINDLAASSNFSDTVSIEFIVEVDGLISGVQIPNSGPEPVRMALAEAWNDMPGWESGLLNQTSVRVRKTITLQIPLADE